jgi:hypothetical protein
MKTIMQLRMELREVENRLIRETILREQGEDNARLILDLQDEVERLDIEIMAAENEETIVS